MLHTNLPEVTALQKQIRNSFLPHICMKFEIVRETYQEIFFKTLQKPSILPIKIFKKGREII